MDLFNNLRNDLHCPAQAVINAFHQQHCTKYNLQHADKNSALKCCVLHQQKEKEKSISLVNFQRKLQLWCETEAILSDTILDQFELLLFF